jgi:hypothetical protein
VAKSFAEAERALAEQGVAIVSRSRNYESRAWGFESEMLFLNVAWEVATELEAEPLLDVLQEVEALLGRDRVAEREQKAADRIFGMLPEDQGRYFMDLWLEFEAVATPEAKFATAIDSVQPLMLNNASNGLAWREHGVAASKVQDRALKKIKPGSEKLYEMVMDIIAENVKKGNLKD